jgi:mannosyl-glycoprotein endo-beta-N-acetylglucosaminidase
MDLSAEHAARQLARIAGWYGFEGWLVNIESRVSASHVEFLDLFLRVLTAEMHALQGKQALVMWYDACDSSGDVHHWCTLNDLNYPFFQVCKHAAAISPELTEFLLAHG